MKKQLTFLIFTLLILLSFNSNSQEAKIEVNGIILDESNNPVPYVAVGIVKKYLGTASTEDGEFSFLITKNELQDSLSISSLGFDPFKINVAEYLKQAKKEIILKETITELNEITLLSPGNYVANAMEALKNNTISDTHLVEMLYRRAATEGLKSKYFVENYIKVRDRGPAYSMGEIEVTEARKSADYRIWKSKFWRHPIYELFHVNPLSPNDSQHSRNLKKFNWSKIGDSSYEGEDVVIIEGKNPKISWEKIIFYIGIDSYKVYKIERGNTLYIYKKHASGKIVLSYFKNEWSFPKHMIPKEYLNTDAETLHYKTEAFVYNVETDKKKSRINPFGLESDMGSLDLPYHPNFWKNLSMPPDTKFYKKIKSELEGNFGVPLETQYEIVNK
jgi:hypothetical protein